MIRRTSPLVAAAIAVGAALVVVGLWWRRPSTPPVLAAVDATVSVRISRHDALGVASKPVVVRERGRVRAFVEALGVDGQPARPCPSDYASAELGLVLSGRDIYARRNVYVWGLSSDAGIETPLVLVTSSQGCRGGPPGDVARLRELVLSAKQEGLR